MASTRQLDSTLRTLHAIGWVGEGGNVRNQLPSQHYIKDMSAVHKSACGYLLIWTEYFSYLGQKIQQEAANQAKIDVSKANMKGEIGSKLRQGQTL
ncbi:unnamed protein product [Lactuca virosa]|uniref:Uncharacterized protein n=1 Tax=Lactuca virosa TaxID=75947 RepID=A0AAU9MPH3_9ASTR|nr:unnamed protein product [Lactuca virosa]